MIRRVLSQTCCTTPAALCFWGIAFLVFYGAGLLVAAVWPEMRQYSDTHVLAALGLACFANFGRNRTFHCGVTGPVFLLGAVAMALIEAGRWEFPGTVLWGVVLIILAVALIAEWQIAGGSSGSDSHAHGRPS